MRASGTTGWCWGGKKAARKGTASEAMPGYYKKTLPGEVIKMRASGTTGWCWTGKSAARKGPASEAMPA
jgi:dienelactone hydrolase